MSVVIRGYRPAESTAARPSGYSTTGAVYDVIEDKSPEAVVIQRRGVALGSSAEAERILDEILREYDGAWRRLA